MSVVKEKRATLAHRIQMLPVEQLVPTPDNGRRPISANSLKSLARSIKKHGVLQPILVRVHPTQTDTWEIRAGFRRWRAAKQAGLERIPAIVGKLDDEAALAVTITENLQRENLHPLEEAAVIQKAFDHGFDVEAVAARLGKNVQFVARRASLTHLAEVWRKSVLTSGTPASRLSPAHLELIARLPEETQDLLAQDDFFTVFGRGFPTVADLQRIIDGGLHTLAAMPWSVDDEALDPKAGACRRCPKRSGAHPMLFDGEDLPTNGKLSKTDRCLDPTCFERKQIAHVQRCESELRTAHPNLTLVQIGSGSMSPTARETFGERVQRVYAPTFLKPSDPNAVPAMQVDGPKAGKLVYLDGGSRTDAPDRKRGGPRPKAEKKPATLDDRRARHHKRRQAFVVKQVDVRLRALSVEEVGQMLGARAGDSTGNACSLEPASLLLAFGTSGRADRGYHEDPWDRYDRLRQEQDDSRTAAAVHDVVQIWVRRLTMHDSSRVEFQASEARRMCEILGIDFAAIEAEAVHALPQPKSWGLSPEEEVPQASTPEEVTTATAADEDSAETPSPRRNAASRTSRRKRAARRHKARHKSKRTRAA